MTPEMLTGLAALLLEFRDWMESYSDDAPLDVELVNAVVNTIGIYRRMVVADGAR